MLLAPIYFLISAAFSRLSSPSGIGQTPPTCYYPDGSPSIENDQPCSSEPGSACCPYQWECLGNGLCNAPEATPAAFSRRYTCTDPTWQSPNCPQFCTDDISARGTQESTECSGGQHCCNTNHPDGNGPSKLEDRDTTDTPRFRGRVMAAMVSKMWATAASGSKPSSTLVQSQLYKRQYDDVEPDASPFPILVVAPILAVLFFVFMAGAICLYCMCCRNRNRPRPGRYVGPINPPPYSGPVPRPGLSFSAPPPIWQPRGRYDPIELHPMDDEKDGNSADFGPKRPYVGDPRKRDIPGMSDV